MSMGFPYLQNIDSINKQTMLPYGFRRDRIALQILRLFFNFFFVENWKLPLLNSI
tara:strand:- start:91 stop:255 length:165 start_codon:yes stop_codon:yes gene_type:complete